MTTQSPRTRRAGRKPPRRLLRPQLIGATQIAANAARYDFDQSMIFQASAYTCFDGQTLPPASQQVNGLTSITVTYGGPVSVEDEHHFTPDPAKVLGANGLSPNESAPILV